MENLYFYEFTVKLSCESYKNDSKRGVQLFENIFKQQYNRARELAERNVEVDVLMALKKVAKLNIDIDLGLESDVIKQQCEAFFYASTGETERVSKVASGVGSFMSVCY